MSKHTTASASVDQDELDKFAAMADAWWDPVGKFKPLHDFNPVRVTYLRDQLCNYFKRDVGDFAAYKGLRILDIGCGGGILSEPLARLGGYVTGIDPEIKNIHVAKAHAAQMNLDIDYRAMTIEALADTKDMFDVVLAMEVVEHVNDVQAFLKTCTKVLKPGGLMVVATLNRTLKSFMLAKVGAEYILRWLPVGTHDWNKFVRPSEITNPLQQSGLKIHEIKGVSFNPLRRQWSLSDDTAVNYMVVAAR